jgi:hypothetical protein
VDGSDSAGRLKASLTQELELLSVWPFFPQAMSGQPNRSHIKGNRDLRFDTLRGALLLIMAINHIDSLLSRLETQQTLMVMIVG